MAFLLWPQDRPTSVHLPCPHFFGATVTSPWITADTSPPAGSPSRRSGGQQEGEGGVGVMVHLAPSSRAGCALAPLLYLHDRNIFLPQGLCTCSLFLECSFPGWLFPCWLFPSFSKQCGHGLSWEAGREGQVWARETGAFLQPHGPEGRVDLMGDVELASGAQHLEL